MDPTSSDRFSTGELHLDTGGDAPGLARIAGKKQLAGRVCKNCCGIGS